MLILFGRLPRHLASGRLPLGQPVLRQRRQPEVAHSGPQEGGKDSPDGWPDARAATRCPCAPGRCPASASRSTTSAATPSRSPPSSSGTSSTSAQAMFDVESYQNLRGHPERDGHPPAGQRLSLRCHDKDTESLRANADEIAGKLKEHVQKRLDKAGVARRRGPPYAPGLRPRDRPGHAPPPAGRGHHRRPGQKIVDGAVGMVEMALRSLESKGVVKLDEEKKAAMVSNLLVVLCGETEVHSGRQHRHALSVTAGCAPCP